LTGYYDNHKAYNPRYEITDPNGCEWLDTLFNQNGLQDHRHTKEQYSYETDNEAAGVGVHVDRPRSEI
jgi:hypothetical protein